VPSTPYILLKKGKIYIQVLIYIKFCLLIFLYKNISKYIDREKYSGNILFTIDKEKK